MPNLSDVFQWVLSFGCMECLLKMWFLFALFLTAWLALEFEHSLLEVKVQLNKKQKEREEINLCILSVVIDSNIPRWLKCRMHYVSWNKPWMQNAAYLHSCNLLFPSHLLLLPSSLETVAFLPSMFSYPHYMLCQVFHLEFFTHPSHLLYSLQSISIKT